MPDWASAGLQTDPGDGGASGIVPKTANAAVRNWVMARLRAFKTYRDAIECMGFDAVEASAQGESAGASDGPDIPSNDRGPHMFWDPENFQFITGQRRNDDPTKAEVSAFYDPWGQAPVPAFSLSSNGDASHSADYYVVLGREGVELNPRTNCYLASLNLRAVTTGGAYGVQLENTADLRLWSSTGSFGGVWTVTGNTPNIPADLLRIGTLIYDPEDSRFYLFGTTTGGGVIIYAVKMNVGPGPRCDYEPQNIRADAVATTEVPRYCAVATGHKVMSTGKEIFRTSNRFSPWYAWSVSTLFPGETEILGLFRADTDGVFVAITASGVWTSPNGVRWSKTAAPAGVYTGAGAALGGVSAVAYRANGVYHVAIATNAFRTWTTVPSPFQNSESPSPGAQPIRQFFALDDRLVAVSGTDPPLLAASLKVSL